MRAVILTVYADELRVDVSYRLMLLVASRGSCSSLSGWHIREERAQSFDHGRMGENGVSHGRVRQTCPDGRLAAAMTSPASAPIIAKPRIRSSPAYAIMADIADPAPTAAAIMIFMRSRLQRGGDEAAELLYLGHSYIQQAIELGPNLIFLGVGDMAKGAFLLRF
jgi:hypothetical protein